MKTKFLFFIAAIFLLYSCQKELSTESGTPNPNPIPVPVIKDSLTVKSIKQTQFGTGDPDSSWIDYFYLDTTLNIITRIQKSSLDNFSDSLIRVFRYNSQKQIISITDEGLPNIEFARDASGKLLTTTTHYQTAIVNQSTGIFTYGTLGSNSTITYLDSVLKFPGSNPYDARSFYRFTFMPDNTVKSYEEFFISTNTTYRKEEYTYDNTNNLIAMTAKDTLGNILQTITYIRDAVKRTSITSFMNRLGGDLFWFNQTKWFNMYPFFNEFDYSFAASAPLKITFPFRFNGSSFSTFTNSYDSKGNLITAVEKNDSGQVISKTEITYN